jgi:hypothetical protein
MNTGDRRIRLLIRFGDEAYEEVSLSAQARPKRLLQSAGRRAAGGGGLLVRRELDGSVVPPHKRLMDLGIGDGEVLVVEPATD